MYNLFLRNSNTCFVLEQTKHKTPLRIFRSSRTNVKLQVGKVHKLYPSNTGVIKSRTAKSGHIERAYETTNACGILVGTSEGKRRNRWGDNAKGKVVPVCTMKAYRESRTMAPLIHNVRSSICVVTFGRGRVLLFEIGPSAQLQFLEH